MIMKKFILFLIFVTLISCGSDDEGSSGPKQLDTSFLSLAEPGTEEIKANISKSDKVIVLDDDQNITLEKNIIKDISNFNLSTLKESQILVGNSKDQLILRILDIRTNRIKVELASIKDLSNEESSNINFVVAPKIDFSSDSNYDEISTNGSALYSTSGSNFNFKGNSLIFKDYDIIDISGDLNAPLKALNFKEAGAVQINANNEGRLKVSIEQGEVSFRPTIKGDYNFSSFGVKSLSNEFHTVLKYRFKINVESDQRMSGMINKELFKDIKIPVRIPGAVPVYMDFIIKFPIGIKFSLADSLKKTFTFAGEYSLKANMNYDDKSGPRFSKKTDFLVLEKSAKADSQKGKYQTEIFFEPRIETRLYRVLGPFSYINASLMGEFDFPLSTGKDDIFASLSGGVGITVSEPIFEKNLLNLKSPSLFNLGYSVDVIGPKTEAKKGRFEVKNQDIKVNEIAHDNRITINVLPTSAHTFYKAHLVEFPKKGLILLDKNFSRNGLIYYYPVIKTQSDTIKVKYEKDGQFSPVATINLKIDQSVYAKKREQLALSTSDAVNLSKLTTKSYNDIVRTVSADIVKYNGENICDQQCVGFSLSNADPYNPIAEIHLIEMWEDAINSPNSKAKKKEILKKFMKMQRPVQSINEFINIIYERDTFLDRLTLDTSLVDISNCNLSVQFYEMKCIDSLQNNIFGIQVYIPVSPSQSISSSILAIEESDSVTPIYLEDGKSFYEVEVIVKHSNGEVEVQRYDIRRPKSYLLQSLSIRDSFNSLMDKYGESFALEYFKKKNLSPQSTEYVETSTYEERF